MTRVGTNRLGGQVVWILGPGLERHYYAPLNRYGTLRVGDRVEAGDISGYGGDPRRIANRTVPRPPSRVGVHQARF